MTTKQPDREALIAAMKRHIREQQREHPRYSQAQFARDVGVAKSTITDILNGKTKNISSNTLSAILGVINNRLVDYRTLFPRGDESSLAGGAAQELPAEFLEMYRSNPERVRELNALFAMLPPGRQTRALDYLRGLKEGD